MIEAVWSLLRPKQNDVEWGQQFKGALLSAYIGRQFTQSRVMAVGWTTHNKRLARLLAAHS